jgi:methionine synthase II (cobalamin-independent)
MNKLQDPDLRGLATGIGSLPHRDARKAVELVFKYAPRIPFWPQLPKRDVREGMLAQFSENLPFLSVDKDGLRFDALVAQDRALEIFYEKIIAGDIDYFKISENYAQGLYAFSNRLEASDLARIKFIKCHITGPFSFAASVKDYNAVALLHDAVFLQALIKGLTMKALWQIRFFQKFGKKIILFIDEPYLSCFGSAYTPLNKEDVTFCLTELTSGIKQSQDVLVGVHCCGNADWSIFTDSAGIDIINFDAFGFRERFVLYADNLKGFLKKGGIICWGIVPTQGFSGQETPESLAAGIQEAIDFLEKKGLDRKALEERLLISPSCGLGSLDIEVSEKILELLAKTSAYLAK